MHYYYHYPKYFVKESISFFQKSLVRCTWGVPHNIVSLPDSNISPKVDTRDLQTDSSGVVVSVFSV